MENLGRCVGLFFKWFALEESHTMFLPSNNRTPRPVHQYCQQDSEGLGSDGCLVYRLPFFLFKVEPFHFQQCEISMDEHTH